MWREETVYKTHGCTDITSLWTFLTKIGAQSSWMGPLEITPWTSPCCHPPVTIHTTLSLNVRPICSAYIHQIWRAPNLFWKTRWHNRTSGRCLVLQISLKEKCVYLCACSCSHRECVLFYECSSAASWLVFRLWLSLRKPSDKWDFVQPVNVYHTWLAGAKIKKTLL